MKKLLLIVVLLTALNGITGCGSDDESVSDPVVYVAGYEHNGTNYQAKYWKNGIKTTLSDGTQTALAESIVVCE